MGVIHIMIQVLLFFGRGFSYFCTRTFNNHSIMEQKKNEEVWLSEHFRLSEFTRSGMAIRLRLSNEPPAEAVENLRQLCEQVLEPLRRRFGVLRVTSGYRCQRLNEAVGGAQNSRHLTGNAADLHVSSPEVGEKMYRFAEQQLDFDELLYEHRRSTGTRWLHVSYMPAGRNRRRTGRIVLR